MAICSKQLTRSVAICVLNAFENAGLDISICKIAELISVRRSVSNCQSVEGVMCMFLPFFMLLVPHTVGWMDEFALVKLDTVC